jgi:hypothetical protein
MAGGEWVFICVASDVPNSPYEFWTSEAGGEELRLPARAQRERRRAGSVWNAQSCACGRREKDGATRAVRIAKERIEWIANISGMGFAQ